MNEKILITDIDGTILDYDGAFSKFINEPIPSAFNRIEYYKENINKVEEFNSSPEFSKLEPIRDSVKALQSFHLCGYKIILVSSCGNSSECRYQRKKNLNNVFGNIFAATILIPLFQPKKYVFEWLKDFHGHEEAILVEDMPKHAQSALDVAWLPYLLKHDYNKHDIIRGVSYVDSWNEIVDNHL